MKRRKKIFVSGIVQGVGFRPAVYRHAVENRISGWVINGPSGVVIEAEGLPGDLNNFLEAVSSRFPARAKIHRVTVEDIPPSGEQGFFIGKSLAGGDSRSIVPADLCLCPDCRSDISDKSGRRYLYPFTNCTNCGPRFTIVKKLPYDRPFTTMRDFKMCPECLAEYENPMDRRFHAQPNACPRCGPEVESLSAGGKPLGKGVDALNIAAETIIKGGIAAIQSLGGFHLACDAANPETVAELRSRKNRPHKPFAVMVRDIGSAGELCRIAGPEAEVLGSVEAPIVMLKKKTAAFDRLAPGLKSFGVMLPYTPLHLVLFDILKERGFSGPLIMTSGNRSDEPICRTKEEALLSLQGIADVFIVHDRPIHNRCDDSVVFVHESKAVPVRRSRGYVPGSIRLSKSGKSVLGCGAYLKTTFCLTRGEEAFLSQHIGDLDEEASHKFYLEALSGMKAFLGVEPEIIAHDLHPDYPSTRMAAGFKGRKIGVQHHFAHIASVMAEHQLQEPVLGAALDGAGYGTDGTIWGCEFMEISEGSWKRLGRLKPFPLPGGDAAVFEIWRTAFSCLKTFLPGELEKSASALFSGVKNTAVIEKMMDSGINSPLTSSMGRLFDAAAFLSGIRKEVSYEAQAAMELESLCRRRPARPFKFAIHETGGMLEADPAPVLEAMLAEKGENRSAAIAEKFHASVPDMVCAVISRLSKKTGIKTVALSGGVFQNRIILEWTSEGLSRRGFKVYANERVPANDGGIALGQAWAASQNAGKKDLNR